MSYDQYVVKIDSKDSVMIGKNPIQLSFPNSNISNIQRITLKNASIPNVFYNIDTYNNKLQFYGNEGAPTVYYFPIGNYTITTLLQTFNTYYGATVLSLNPLTNKIMFSFATDLTFDHNNSTIFYNLGLDENVDFYVGSNTVNPPTSAPYMPDLSGVKNIYIESNLSAMNTIETTGHKGYISNIGVTSPFGSIIQYVNQEMDLETVNRKDGYNQSLQNVTITLRDSHSRLLNMQNVDWHINVKIVFKVD
jgi:hypothetical protein